ncbi:MAG: hypothetical protein R2940_16290 [Syntrophotaleaceae bacterium]
MTEKQNSDRNLRMDEVRTEKLGGISRVTFWRLRQRPDFPAAIEISPGLKLFKESEIDAFIDRQKRTRV